jgi:Protein of unknown function (DUF3987)
MVQPEAAQAFLSDSLLRSQGLLSRILIASPPTMAGTRFYRLSDEHDSSSIRAYSRVIGRLLEMPWPLADGKRNELLPRVLECSSDAVEVWREFHDHIEGRSGPSSELAAVREFAGKAAEHAARIAGVLAVVADAGAQEIGANTMRDAAALVEWYVGESQRLAAAAMTDPRIARAQRLLEWTRASGVNADGVRVGTAGLALGGLPGLPRPICGPRTRPRARLPFWSIMVGSGTPASLSGGRWSRGRGHDQARPRL